MTGHKLERLVNSLLRALYVNSTPKGDWDAIVKRGSRAGNFWQKHTLSQEKQDALEKRIFGKYKLNKFEEMHLQSMLLMYSPTYGKEEK